MLAAVGAVVVCAAMISVGWAVIGPGAPVFVLVVSLTVLGSAGFTGPIWDRLGLLRVLGTVQVADRWLRFLGVAAFGHVLHVLGLQVQRRLESPSRIPYVMGEVARSFGGHLFGSLVHVVVALVQLAAGWLGPAGLLLAAAVPLHVYPALLQILVYRRLATLEHLLRQRQRNRG